MFIRRKSSLETNKAFTDPQAVLLLALLAAPLAMAAATVAERHAGPSMAGCLMAIPITLPIGVIAVGTQYGNAAPAPAPTSRRPSCSHRCHRSPLSR
jgi:lipopolysaccharide export LptBFGC system permease protein LptF